MFMFTDVTDEYLLKITAHVLNSLRNSVSSTHFTAFIILFSCLQLICWGKSFSLLMNQCSFILPVVCPLLPADVAELFVLCGAGVSQKPQAAL